MNDLMGLIYTGDNGDRMNELTALRAVAAVPVCSRYRVIDFLYYILSFEIIHKIPFLCDYLNKKQEEEAAVQGA